MSTIGLCMIVKNEAKVILNCLRSVLPLIDYALIVDTGSQDGTQDLIRKFLNDHGIPGVVLEEPWRNFAYNRTSALNALRQVPLVEYALVIDADDVLVIEPDFDPASFKSGMTADVYDLKITHGNIFFFRAQLFRNDLNFSFKAVLHEYLELPPEVNTRETASGFWIATSRGGARSQNPNKYRDDAKVLEEALRNETDPFLISRYTFYLAQSYKDVGEHERALENYQRRARMGYWDQEVYVSHLEAGNMMAILERPFEHVIEKYEEANQLVPPRAEALHAASRYCRNQKRYRQGLDFARRGVKLPEPSGLFIHPWIYTYGLLDELAVNGYWAGAYHESLDACISLLNSETTPESMFKRIAANARFAFDKLAQEEPKQG